MKTILCYGDSNTWGWIPGTAACRYDETTRWCGVMRALLGSEYQVIEAGQNGRTTVLDDPVEYDRNGYTHFFTTMDCAHPIDLVIVMLGTNDCKARFGVNGFDIANSLGQLAAMAVKSEFGPDGMPPKLLLVNPVWISEAYAAHPVMAPALGPGAVERSKEIGKYLPQVAERWNAAYFDANLWAKSSPVDGVHLLPEDHEILGRHMAEKVQELLK